MSQIRTSRAGRTAALVLSSILGLAMITMAGGFASTATATSSSSAVAAAEPVEVAHTAAGSMTSAITGTTGNGRAVSGAFTPLKFIKKDGRVLARGVIDGVVTNADGSTRTFTTIRNLKVKNINGEPVRTARAAAQAAATCDVLHLVLGPLDLDLLGLQVHLDRVVLDIVAVSGAGNLLGNLLCAVTGLLDGGLSGLLGRLTNLLNQILGQLGLGL